MRFAYLALLTTLLLGISRYARAESASNLYLLNCWGCHGSHGEGIKGTAPPLIDLSDFLKVDGGRAYIIEVPGVSLSALNDGQIATVMNWLLETMSKHDPSHDFSPYTADEIHRYRQVRLTELSKTRRELLEQLVAMKVRTSAN